MLPLIWLPSFIFQFKNRSGSVFCPVPVGKLNFNHFHFFLISKEFNCSRAIHNFGKSTTLPPSSSPLVVTQPGNFRVSRKPKRASFRRDIRRVLLISGDANSNQMDFWPEYIWQRILRAINQRNWKELSRVSAPRGIKNCSSPVRWFTDLNASLTGWAAAAAWERGTFAILISRGVFA